MTPAADAPDDTAPDPVAAPAAPRPRVLVGLGNPGAQYVETRHNVGFRTIEELARRRGLSFDGRECNSHLATGPEGGLLLLLPQTFMNRSGHACRCLRDARGLEAEDFLVVYDEVHLPLGSLRLRPSGSPAGHRGMESVIESLGTDAVARLRLGVGPADGPPPGADLPDFVLAPFERDEHEAVTAMIERAADACDAWLADGLDAARQRYNGPPR